MDIFVPRSQTQGGLKGVTYTGTRYNREAGLIHTVSTVMSSKLLHFTSISYTNSCKCVGYVERTWVKG